MVLRSCELHWDKESYSGGEERTIMILVYANSKKPQESLSNQTKCLLQFKKIQTTYPPSKIPVFYTE